MSAGETARTNYESARNELVQRIQLREQVLLFFVGGVATIYSVALGAENKLEILLAVPYLAFGTAVILSQHNAVIGALGHFCVHEIGPFLKKLEPSEHAPLWESSASLHQYSSKALGMRTLAHIVLIVTPALLGLLMNRHEALLADFAKGIIWWIGCSGTGLALGFLVVTHVWRKKLYQAINWHDIPDEIKVS
jgi:hypothetical protein